MKFIHESVIKLQSPPAFSACILLQYLHVNGNPINTWRNWCTSRGKRGAVIARTCRQTIAFSPEEGAEGNVTSTMRVTIYPGPPPGLANVSSDVARESSVECTAWSSEFETTKSTQTSPHSPEQDFRTKTRYQLKIFSTSWLHARFPCSESKPG